MSELDAQNQNKENSFAIYTLSIGTSIQNINDEIGYVQSLIDQINSKLPRSIDDIVAGNISQSDNPKQCSINIRNQPYKIIDPINPNRGTINTGKWVIDAILPRGQKGEPGIQGPPGDKGDKGIPGEAGSSGRRGNWGSKS